MSVSETRTSSGRAQASDVETMSLTDLVNHIEQTHHGYLHSELPRLDKATAWAVSVHGEKDARLREVRRTVLALADELSSHMMKEERILFPMVRQLEASTTLPVFHCGSLANPISQMELDHEDAESALTMLRTLTDGFSSPEWACDSYRDLLAALAHLERDLRQHIHTENDVLFPQVVEMEKRKSAARRSSKRADSDT